MIRALVTATLLSLTVLGLGACSSTDDTAARDASVASANFQAGALDAAHRNIRAALAIRDDLPEYWLLLAQIASAQGDGRETYEGYRNAIALDRGNLDALRALCQLGVQYGSPEDLTRFADQLAVLAPNDPLIVTARGNAALLRGNVKDAEKYADQALAAQATDLNALILKSRILRTAHKYTEAGDLLKKASFSIGASTALISALVQIYADAGNRPDYKQALADLVKQQPDNIDAAVKLADLQYQDGDRDGARATIAQISEKFPFDVGLGDTLLSLWLDQGPDALTPTQISEDGTARAIEIRAAYAQYANEMHHPEIALALTQEVRGRGFGAGLVNAQTAMAEAMAQQGNIGDATTVIGAVLKADATLPRALIARSRLAWARGDKADAISDARQVVAEDAENQTARILLARYLDGAGEPLLALSALREGMSAAPGSPRVAEALVRMLVAQHKAAEGVDVLAALAQASSVNLRFQQTRARLCPLTGVPTCNAPLPKKDTSAS